MARSKNKSRSRHKVLHLHTLANVPTHYQLPTPYGCQDIAMGVNVQIWYPGIIIIIVKISIIMMPDNKLHEGEFIVKMVFLCLKL